MASVPETIISFTRLPPIRSIPTIMKSAIVLPLLFFNCNWGDFACKFFVARSCGESALCPCDLHLHFCVFRRACTVVQIGRRLKVIDRPAALSHPSPFAEGGSGGGRQ